MTEMDLSRLKQVVERLYPPTPEPEPLPQPLILRPGDTLILHSKARLDEDEFEQLRTRLADRAPGLKVAILEGNIDVVAVYRIDQPTEEAADVR